MHEDTERQAEIDGDEERLTSDVEDEMLLRRLEANLMDAHNRVMFLEGEIADLQADLQEQYERQLGVSEALERLREELDR